MEPEFEGSLSPEEELERDRTAQQRAEREASAPRGTQRAPTSEELSESYTLEEVGDAQRRRAAQRFGLKGEALEEYLRLQRVSEGRGPDSAAVRDIMAERASLQALATGQAGRARDPFAGTRQALAQRAGREVATSAERQISAQRLAEQERAREIMKQLRMGAEIRQEQERLAREQRESLFAGGIGSLLGAGLGAGLVAASGGAALPVYASAITGGGTFGGQIGQMISDERMKSNVRDGNSDAKAMLDALSAKKYDKFGKEEVGVMAQDLEKSKAGDKMVKEVEGVKTIPKGFGEVLAAMANLNDRLSKLEKK
tara:strand:- start:172 stop:1110 length:939 start_codon:yes stop_codon:yes gene_type:complete